MKIADEESNDSSSAFLISKCANISAHLDINNCTAVDKEKEIDIAQEIEQQLCDEKTTNTEIAVFF